MADTSILGRLEGLGARLRGDIVVALPDEAFAAPSIETFAAPIVVQKVSTREMSRDTADFASRSFNFNGLEWVDQLVQRKGLKIYDEMLENDAQIANAYYLKKYMRLVNGWDIRPFEEGDKESEELAKFVKWNFDEFLDGSIDGFLDKMWDAMRLGYKVAEMIWEPITQGEYKGKIGLKKLKVRKSSNYRFDTDVHGNIRKNGLLELTGDAEGTYRNLPVRKFVIFSWGKLDDDGTSHYGRSEFRVAFRYYAANDFIHTKWLRRLEDISNPCPVATIDGNMIQYTDEERTKAAEDLANLNHLASYVAPPGMKLGMWPTGFGDVSGGKTSESGFVEALNWNSQMESKALLVGSLVQQEGKVSGSYALGKIHFETLIHCLDQLGRLTGDELMREQVIARMVNLNFTTDKYPRFYMPSLIEDDPVPKAKVLEILVQNGMVHPQEPWVRDFVGVPSNLSWKPESEKPVMLPVVQQPQGATTPNDVAATTAPVKEQAAKQAVDKNKEGMSLNPKKMKHMVKRYLMEQFIVGTNERIDPGAAGNPQWSKIMKGLQRYGVGVMPLPNTIIPMDIYVQVEKCADRFAHALAGAYRDKVEQNCQTMRERRWFRKLDHAKRVETVENISTEAYKEADIEETLLKFGSYFRAGQFENGGE